MNIETVNDILTLDDATLEEEVALQIGFRHVKAGEWVRYGAGLRTPDGEGVILTEDSWYPYKPPPYTRSDTYVMELVEHMRQAGYDVTLTFRQDLEPGCRVAPRGEFNTEKCFFVAADTYRRAVCRAFLIVKYFIEGRTEDGKDRRNSSAGKSR